jgi:hypothetical protein
MLYYSASPGRLANWLELGLFTRELLKADDQDYIVYVALLILNRTLVSHDIYRFLPLTLSDIKKLAVPSAHLYCLDASR